MRALEDWQEKVDGEPGQEYVKMEFCLLDKEAEMQLTRLMIHMRVVQKIGPAPPMKDIRAIRDLLKDLK